MQVIASAANPRFRRWRELTGSRGIRKHGECLLSGERLLQEFLARPDRTPRAELLRPGLSPLCPPALQVPAFELAPALFDALDVLGTHHNLLVLEAPPLPAFEADAPPRGLELICPLGDPANLGALARSALAFGASRLVLTRESASPYHPRALKASAGALLQLPLVQAGALADMGSLAGGLWALDLAGEPVDGIDWPADLRLLVGEEGPGLPPLPAARRLTVPTVGVESLNATVAASIALFCHARRRTAG